MPYGFSERIAEAAEEQFSQEGRLCACGEELLINHEIKAGKCLVCMMLEFQKKIEREEEEHES